MRDRGYVYRSLQTLSAHVETAELYNPEATSSHCKKDITSQGNRTQDGSLTIHLQSLMMVNKIMPYPGTYLPGNKETHNKINVKTEGRDIQR